MFAGTKKLMSRAALVLAATAALGACDNTNEPDDHNEAFGMVITDQNNTTLLSINAARQVTGSLTVRAGQARHLEVYFLDEDGDRFQLEDGDDEYRLEATVANPNIATIEAHGDHMDLAGVTAGATTAEFSIMHGNHPDYESGDIAITVTP